MNSIIDSAIIGFLIGSIVGSVQQIIFYLKWDKKFESMELHKLLDCSLRDFANTFDEKKK